MPSGPLTVTVRLQHAWLLRLALSAQLLGLLDARQGELICSWLLKRLCVIERGGKR